MQLMTNTMTTTTCENYWHLLDLFLTEAGVVDGFTWHKLKDLRSQEIYNLLNLLRENGENTFLQW